MDGARTPANRPSLMPLTPWVRPPDPPHPPFAETHAATLHRDTMAGVSELIERWRAACRPATAAPADVDAAGRDLLRRWSEPHRHYHNVAHLTAVLYVIDAHDGSDQARLAAWFHDAVYDPRSPGDANEQASAALAADTLSSLGVAAPDVVRLVLLTAGHAPGPDDPDGILLCDADLTVLARPAPEYDVYAAAIRREYAHVPEDAFRAGRAAVLRHLLRLPALYRLPALTALEPAARANVTRELNALT